MAGTWGRRGTGPQIVARPRNFAGSQIVASCGPVSVCLSVCVCLFLTSRCSIEVVGRIELVFGMGASLDQSHAHCVLRKFRYLQTYEILPPHIDRRTCCQLSLRKVNAQSVINWTIVGQLS